ncbi:MAG: hypothetical protein U1A77_18715 [Pirellulales bacterium]
MFLARWLRRLTQVSTPTVPKRRPSNAGRSLRIESLECRSLMAGVVELNLGMSGGYLPGDPAGSALPSTPTAWVSPGSADHGPAGQSTSTMMRNATVTITVQGSNDAPLLNPQAAAKPCTADGTSPGTVTITLQNTNDAPVLAPSRTVAPVSPIQAPSMTVTITVQGTNDLPS